MTFTYVCPAGDHFEAAFLIGQAPESVPCVACPQSAARCYGEDWDTLQLKQDPFRTFHLGAKKHAAESEQQRPIGGPQDMVEKRAIEAATGRSYVGDDTSGMTKAARRGIEKFKSKV